MTWTPSLRVAMQLPLSELWDKTGVCQLSKSDKFFFEDFPNQRFFVTSEWSGKQMFPVTLLWRLHPSTVFP